MGGLIVVHNSASISSVLYDLQIVAQASSADEWIDKVDTFRFKGL
jgi:hypothetical protein